MENNNLGRMQMDTLKKKVHNLNIITREKKKIRFEYWKIVRKIDRGFKTSNYALKNHSGYESRYFSSNIG